MGIHSWIGTFTNKTHKMTKVPRRKGTYRCAKKETSYSEFNIEGWFRQVSRN